VVSWKKGGYGLNLQAASYCFFYESPVGAIDRDQCERRIWRQGQKNKCFIYDLVMKDSVDSKILLFHTAATNLFEAMVKDPSSILS
jgi:SNF2 family DNA or RNA helicase